MPSGDDDDVERDAALPGEVTVDEEADAAEATDEGNTAAAEPDDKAAKIVRQVEYYFSDENLPTDEYLLTRIRRNKLGWVPLSCILKFNKMKRLCKGDVAVAAAALRAGSTALEVNPSGTSCRRLAPLPPHDPFEVGARTVLVENLPPESTAASLTALFAAAGSVRVARLCPPSSSTASTLHAAAASSDPWCKLNVVCAQHHALVEFSTREEAQNAVNTLNDGTNWRTGLRVRLVRRDVAKHKVAAATPADGDADADADAAAAPGGEDDAVARPAVGTPAASTTHPKAPKKKKDYAAWASVAAHKQAKAEREPSTHEQVAGQPVGEQAQVPQRLAPRRFFSPRAAPPASAPVHAASAPGSASSCREARMPDGTRGFAGVGRGVRLHMYPPARRGVDGGPTDKSAQAPE